MIPHPHVPGRRRLAPEQGTEERRLTAGNLAFRQRREPDGLHPSGQRTGDPGAQQRIGRSGQQEAPGRPVLVHRLLDGEQSLRHPLHFVQRNPLRRKIADEADGIRAGHLRLRDVVEGDVLPAVVDQVFDQGRLPHLPRAHDEYHGRIGERFAHEAGAEPWKDDGGLLRWGKGSGGGGRGSG